MSYILDALKKSEKQRQRGTVPGVLTVQDVAVPEPGRRLLWPYVLFGTVLLGAGVLAWWSLYLHSVTPARVEQAGIQKQYDRAKTSAPQVALNKEERLPINNPAASNPPGRNAGASRPDAADGKSAVRSRGPMDSLPNRASKSAREAAHTAIMNEKTDTQNKGGSEKTSPAEPLVRHNSPAPAPGQADASQSAPAPKPVEAVIPPPENRIYNLTELPPVVSQGLPQFAISTHIYSVDPASRLTRINGQTLREGQDLAAGLKLIEITSDGVIMRYKDYRFRISLR